MNITNTDTKKGKKIAQIGKRAVDAAKAENEQKGKPTVFSEGGIIYYRFPDGSVTSISPFENM